MEKTPLLPILNKYITPTTEIAPVINIGSLFDIPNGTTRKGKWGNTIIDGGAWRIVGIMGPNNSFKSTLSKYFVMALMNNYPESNAITLDTEISGTGAERYISLSSQFDNLSEEDFRGGERWIYTTNDTMYGNDFWSMVRAYAEDKSDPKVRKQYTRTLPWVNESGEYQNALIPTAVEIDSISQFSIKQVDERIDKVDIGDKGRNMEDMNVGKAKSKMVREMPVTTARGSMYVTMTAHVGKEFDLDPYAPKIKKFQNQQNGLTAKYIPEAFQYNVNVLYEIIKAVPLLHPKTKEPMFPVSAEESVVGDTDLMELHVNITRGKAGGTGFRFNLLVTQSRGLLVGLSDLWFLKQHGNFGISGNDVRYYLDLCPEIVITRNTARQLIDDHPELRRALRFTVDLYISKFLQKIQPAGIPAAYIVSPAELYQGIKDKGYDWNELYDTINEWKFREEEQTKPTLTIFDLLKMNAGLYVPYWKQPEWIEAQGKKWEKLDVKTYVP